MPQRQRPPRLRPGGRLGIVAPSSPIPEPSMTARGVAVLTRLGFETVPAPHAEAADGHLAGPDADRAADLLLMLERDDIDGVICLRGGMGAIRTAMALDGRRLAALRERPAKAFIGFSDITVPHAVLGRALNWVTFYGPMVITMGRATPYTLEAFRRALMAADPFEIEPDPDDPYVGTVVPGVAEGELVGGCLALLATLVGTPWEPDYRGKVVFFEDVDEDPSQIERFLAQLLAAGRLQSCAGILIGEHHNCGRRDPEPMLGLERVFSDLLRPLGVPVLYHLPVGHGRHIATLPIGAPVRLYASGGRFQVLEGGVS
ncbi:MAG TPA: LD-carboxypeptidase [Candidatus Dormibacteraeota bacterium]|nr:LD-carboxypeptidase [Candidatus Dormibacteraeota bacterium]